MKKILLTTFIFLLLKVSYQSDNGDAASNFNDNDDKKELKEELKDFVKDMFKVVKEKPSLSKFDYIKAVQDCVNGSNFWRKFEEMKLEITSCYETNTSCQEDLIIRKFSGEIINPNDNDQSNIFENLKTAYEASNNWKSYFIDNKDKVDEMINAKEGIKSWAKALEGWKKSSASFHGAAAAFEAVNLGFKIYEYFSNSESDVSIFMKKMLAGFERMRNKLRDMKYELKVFFTDTEYNQQISMRVNRVNHAIAQSLQITVNKNVTRNNLLRACEEAYQFTATAFFAVMANNLRRHFYAHLDLNLWQEKAFEQIAFLYLGTINQYLSQDLHCIKELQVAGKIKEFTSREKDQRECAASAVVQMLEAAAIEREEKFWQRKNVEPIINQALDSGENTTLINKDLIKKIEETFNNRNKDYVFAIAVSDAVEKREEVDVAGDAVGVFTRNKFSAVAWKFKRVREHIAECNVNHTNYCMIMKTFNMDEDYAHLCDVVQKVCGKSVGCIAQPRDHNLKRNWSDDNVNVASMTETYPCGNSSWNYVNIFAYW